MTDETINVSDKDDPTKNPDAGGEGDKNVVAYETYKKVLDQRKSDQDKLKETQARLDALEAEKRTQEDEKTKSKEKELEASGNWKAILEDREKKLKDLEKENKRLAKENKGFESHITDAKKISALQQKIGGNLKNPKLYDLIDTSKIALDPESGEIDESSVSAYANEFVKEFKFAIDFGKGSNLPGDAARGSGTSISLAEWKKLPVAEKRKRIKDVKD